MNPLFNIDFYKAGHRQQYPEGTEMVYSNFTPRSSRLFKGSKFYDDKVVVLGIQQFIQDFLIEDFNQNFFNQPKELVVNEYKELMDECLGPDAIPVDHVEALHDLGYLPIVIKALPEGTRAPMRVPVLTIENTMPEFFWLVNYLETVMSSELWGPMTGATIAFEYKRILTDAAERTGAPMDFVPLQAHDFSFRGMSSRETSTKLGIGHLTSFIGTDNVPAIAQVKRAYGCANGPVGVSVPATEHSVMCAGSKEGEIETFRRIFEDIYPTGIVSIVSDTWDFWQVVTEFLPQLKDKIMARQPNALGLNKVVIRPDSGDPVKIICGDKFNMVDPKYYKYDTFKDWQECVAELVDEQFCDNLDAEAPHPSETTLWKFEDKYFKVTYEPDLDRHDKRYYFVDNWGDDLSKCTFQEITPTPEQKGAIECLWETFGGTETEKGYKLLDEHIGLIYGDSITLERCQEICDRLADKGFASTNVVFGVGSYTYQYNTRDTFGFAMKATAVKINGEYQPIFKDPKTDSGTKKSAKGFLAVVKEDGEYVLKESDKPFTPFNIEGNELQAVFVNGKARLVEDWDLIRERLGGEL